WFAYLNGVSPFEMDATRVPAWYTVSSEVVGQLATILLAPVWMMGLSLLYVDQRVRHEGYDIELMAAQRFGEMPQLPAGVHAPGAQYRERVREAVAPLEELAAFCEQLSKNEKPEVWSKEGFNADLALEFPKRSRDALGRVRALLPPKEKVATGGGAIEVDNSWLQSSLQEFERASDNDKRARSLRSTAERLRALDSRLAEAEAVGRTQDKDAERGRLNTILRDPEFNRQAERGNALQRLIEQIIEWINDLLRKIFPGRGALKPGTNPRVSQLAQIIVLAVCLAVIAYVAWFVWSRRKRELKTLKLKRRARVVLGERLEADQTSADLLTDA